MQTKKCTSKWHLGGKATPLQDFSRDKNRKDGYHNHCKKCRRQARQHWYETNHTEIREKLKDDYYLDHETTKKKQNKLAQAYHKKRGICWGLFMSVKTRATKRRLLCDLTEQDIVIPDKCPILGIPLTKEYGPRTENYPTIDRTDNTKGYTKDNIQIISWRANDLKRTATLDELVKLGDHARALLERQTT